MMWDKKFWSRVGVTLASLVIVYYIVLPPCQSFLYQLYGVVERLSFPVLGMTNWCGFAWSGVFIVGVIILLVLIIMEVWRRPRYQN